MFGTVLCLYISKNMISWYQKKYMSMSVCSCVDNCRAVVSRVLAF